MDYISNDCRTSVSSSATPLAAAQPLHQGHDRDPTAITSPIYSPRIKPMNSPNSAKYSGLEVESVSSSSSDKSWMKRIRWFRNTRKHRDSKGTPPEGTQYVGGAMESAPSIPVRTTAVREMQHAKPEREITTTFGRIASWMTANSSHHEDDSVGDFKESEWTPEDSSYGAACPLFGWIPKSTRRSIEFALLLLLVIGLVYLMVMLSIVISEARSDNSIADDTAVLDLDDDRYIGYTDDDQGGGDDDPYWSSNNSGGNGGRRHRYYF